MNHDEITQYFSKWLKEWVFFTNPMGEKYIPNDAEIKEHTKYHYELR